VSLNLRRRHLDESQRAMVAAKLAILGHGGDRSSSKFAACSVPTQGEAAALLNISERSVRSAREVQEGGAPELGRNGATRFHPNGVRQIISQFQKHRKARTPSLASGGIAFRG